MKSPILPLSCDDWTFHTLKLFLRGRQAVELIPGIKASLLQPDLYRKALRDPNSGRAWTLRSCPRERKALACTASNCNILRVPLRLRPSIIVALFTELP